MGFNTAENRAEYTATSGQTVFPFSFKAYEETDLKVYITPDGQTASDANDIKTLNVDYTVTIDGDNGGLITLLSGATDSDAITLIRELPVQREIDYQQNGDLLAQTLNDDQNYQTYLMGDVVGREDRYVKLPDAAQNVSSTLPAPEADQYIRWSEDGSELVNDGTYPAAIQTAVDAADDAQEDRDAVQILHDNVVAKEALVNPHYTAIDSIYANETNVNIVATNIADVNTVADDIAKVIKVADDLSEAISEVETVANDLNEATSEIDTVANNIANVNTVGSNIGNVNTVAGINSNVTTVAGISANVTTVAGNNTNITSVANNLTNINNVAANSTNINSAVSNETNINTVANNTSNINLVANNTANITTTATNITNVNTVGTNIASINNASANIDSINNFGDTYFVGDTAPTSPTEGDLWFDSSTDIMKVYNGSSWQSAGSSVNGTSERQTYTATSGQTDFAATYDAGFIDVYLNGIKLLDGTDFTATNGTTVVMSQGLSTGDIVDIVAYGTFELADVYTQAQADSLLDAKADIATTLNGYGITDSYTKTEVNNKPSGFKNYIINGGFDVWQRGTSFSSVSGYTADRWHSAQDGGTVSISKDVNSGIALSYSSSSTGWVHINQKIEGRNFRNIVYGVSTVTLTLSFKAWCSNNEECTLYIDAPTAEDNYTSTTTVLNTPFTLNSNGNYKTFTFDVSASVLKNGLRVYLVDNQGTAGNSIVWQNVQLELGSVATPFEQRPYGLELSLCQRYYQQFSYKTSGAYDEALIVDHYSIPFIAQMRTAPSIRIFDFTKEAHTSGNLAVNAPSTFDMTDTHIIFKWSSGNSGLRTYSYVASGNLGLDAEL